MALNDGNPGGVPEKAERDRGLDRLYAAAGREEPPPRLDAAIYAAARREVGARPRPLSLALRRWRVPVSIAAVVVLSVSLVTLVNEQGGEPLRQSPPEVAPTTQPAPVVPETPLMRQQATPPAPPAQRQGARAGAPATADKLASGNVAGGEGPTASESAGTAARESASKPQSQPFRDSSGMLEQRAAPAPRAAPGEDLLERAPMAAERRAAPMSAAPAPEPTEARSMMQDRKEAAGAASADRSAPVWHGYEKEPPQKWLDRISELRRLQRAADAEAMLAEFRRRFPGHPVPQGAP